jgi:hypothetical protein
MLNYSNFENKSFPEKDYKDKVKFCVCDYAFLYIEML